MIEIYKILNNLTDNVHDDLFIRSSHDISLRSRADLVAPSVNSVYKGKNSLRYLGSIIWNSLPIEIRDSETLFAFKSKIKVWYPDNCECRLCKEYIEGVGFI